MKKTVLILIFMLSTIFIGIQKADAATNVDFYVECNYKYTMHADQTRYDNDSTTVYYSGMKDSDGDEIGLVAYEYKDVPGGATEFGVEANYGKWYDFFNGETSKPVTSFKSIYTSTKQCPKYLYAEFTSQDFFGDKYYKMVFSDTKPDICVANDAKCKILGESSGTVKKVTYYEEEDFWEYTYSGDKTCDKLHVKIYIAGKQFKADYDNALGSGYTSLAVKGETVKNVDFEDIYNIANGKNPDIYINPNEGGSLQKQGVSFGTSLGTDYCHLTDGMPTGAKSCKTYDEVKATVVAKQDEALGSSKSIDDVANKYLTFNRTSDTYSSKSYSTVTDVTTLSNTASEINKALKDSTFSATSTSYIDYLNGLISGKTLCTDAEEQVKTILSSYSDLAAKKAAKVTVLQDTLTKIKERLTALGETDKAAEVDGYITNAQTVASDITSVSAKARASFLSDQKFNIGEIAGATCGVISKDLQEFLQTIIDYIRIAGIVLAVILGILDYIKVIFGTDEKQTMSKANKNFSTRLIAVALLFLIPAVITFILGLFNILGTGDAGTCGIN